MDFLVELMFLVAGAVIGHIAHDRSTDHSSEELRTSLIEWLESKLGWTSVFFKSDDVFDLQGKYLNYHARIYKNSSTNNHPTFVLSINLNTPELSNVLIQPKRLIGDFFVPKYLFVGTSDQAFDSRFNVQGSVPYITALLDNKARQLLLSCQVPIQIEDGYLKVFFSNNTNIKKEIQDTWKDITELIAIMSLQKDDIARKLCLIIDNDPIQSIKSNALQQLIANYVGTQVLERQLQKIKMTSDPNLLLLAAMHVGHRDLDFLKKLAHEHPLFRTDAALLAVSIITFHPAAPSEVLLDIIHLGLNSNGKARLQMLDALGRFGDQTSLLYINNLLDDYHISKDMQIVAQNTIRKIQQRCGIHTDEAYGTLSLTPDAASLSIVD